MNIVSLVHNKEALFLVSRCHYHDYFSCRDDFWSVYGI